MNDLLKDLKKKTQLPKRDNYWIALIIPVQKRQYQVQMVVCGSSTSS